MVRKLIQGLIAVSAMLLTVSGTLVVMGAGGPIAAPPVAYKMA